MQGYIVVKWPQDGYLRREMQDRRLVFEMNFFPSIVEKLLWPPLSRLVKFTSHLMIKDKSFAKNMK